MRKSTCAFHLLVETVALVTERKALFLVLVLPVTRVFNVKSNWKWTHVSRAFAVGEVHAHRKLEEDFFVKIVPVVETTMLIPCVNSQPALFHGDLI